MEETKLKKPTRVLCKRALVNGKPYYWNDWSEGAPTRHERDNRMLVEGDWYDVIESEHDSWDEEKRQFTFTIIDNQNNPHLFFMYEEQDKKNWPDVCNLYGPRDYAKWFYTPEELILLEKGEFKLEEDIVVYPGNHYWVKYENKWTIALCVGKHPENTNQLWKIIGSTPLKIDDDFEEIGEQILSQEKQLQDKARRIASDVLIEEVSVLMDAINKPDPDKEYPSVEYITPFVNKAMDNYFETSFSGFADFFETGN
jgi:hypothetical protein